MQMKWLNHIEDRGDSDSTGARLVFTPYHNTIKRKFGTVGKVFVAIYWGERFFFHMKS